MTIEERCHKLVLDAVAELNESLAEPNRLRSTMDEPLWGEKSKLDSLALVQLLTILEEKAHDELDVEIRFDTLQAFSGPENPFRTIGTLSEYVSAMVKNAHGSQGASH